MTAEVYQGFPLFESVDVNSSFIVPNGNLHSFLTYFLGQNKMNSLFIFEAFMWA